MSHPKAFLPGARLMAQTALHTTVAALNPFRMAKGVCTVTVILMCATAQLVHAADTLSPVELLTLSRAAGERMARAGFDQASNMKWVLPGEGVNYELRSDTVLLTSPRTAYDSDVARQAMSPFSDAEMMQVFAAHEHCHAYLWKHRHTLPDAVKRAADACNVVPHGVTSSLLDEAFCDMAAISVYDAAPMMLAIREQAEADENIRHSFQLRLVKAALAAEDRSERNVVTRVANALESACQAPDFQALRGTGEADLGTDIAVGLADYLKLAPDQVPPVPVLPFAQWDRPSQQRFEVVRREIGELPLLAFKGAYEGCLRDLDKTGRHSAADFTRAVGRCQLTPEAYDQAFCSMVGEKIGNAAMRERFITPPHVVGRLMTNGLFGNGSLPSLTLRDNHDYLLVGNEGDYFADISLAIEFACGASPPEHAGAKRATLDDD
ncbi:MAG: hypothetical protein KA271_00895 [Propionivibrio sp.]|nr:hypothetical protein [Propionivibrio sp.]